VTVRIWPAPEVHETHPLPVFARGGDRTVQLLWRRMPHAVAYRIYRGAAEGQRALAPLTSRPIVRTTFTDRGPGLVNGRPVSYAVARVFRDGREGARVTVPVTPVTAPPGFMGSSINEGSRTGSAVYHPASREIVLRGSGRDFWNDADGGYFLSRPVTGDFQITVQLLSRPTETHAYAKAGLMIRESLEAEARNAHLVATALQGVQWQCRPTAAAATVNVPDQVIPHADLKLPLLVRLTRLGNRIFAEYSTDQGQRFQSAGEPVTFDPPLPATLYAGPAITADNGRSMIAITPARFAPRSRAMAKSWMSSTEN